MLTKSKTIRRGDRVVVIAPFSTYRGQEGKVLEFTASRKSVKIQLARGTPTVRVTSVERVAGAVKTVEEAARDVEEQLERLVGAVQRYLELKSQEKRSEI